MDAEPRERVEAIMQAEAEQGRLYPPEFISTIAMQACMTVKSYLIDHGAPKGFMNLVDMAFFMQEVATFAHAGDIPNLYAGEFYLVLPETTRLIVEWGGTFHDEAGETARHELPAWRPALATDKSDLAELEV